MSNFLSRFSISLHSLYGCMCVNESPHYDSYRNLIDMTTKHRNDTRWCDATLKNDDIMTNGNYRLLLSLQFVSSLSLPPSTSIQATWDSWRRSLHLEDSHRPSRAPHAVSSQPSKGDSNRGNLSNSAESHNEIKLSGLFSPPIGNLGLPVINCR